MKDVCGLHYKKKPHKPQLRSGVSHLKLKLHAHEIHISYLHWFKEPQWKR